MSWYVHRDDPDGTRIAGPFRSFHEADMAAAESGDGYYAEQVEPEPEPELDDDAEIGG